MPARYQEYGELWKELNPHHEVHDWTEEEIMDIDWYNSNVLDDLYKKSKQPGADLVAYYTHVADVVDYEIIWKHGGWYFNVDIKPIKPLAGLASEGELQDWPALAMEDDIHPVNMAMYSPGLRNGFFGSVIYELPKRYFSMPGAFMNASTGVQLLQQVVKTYSGPIFFYHRDIFNPIHWSQFDYGAYPEIDREYPESTVAVHEWYHRTNQRNQRVI